MSKPLRRSSGWIAASALTILALALVGSARAPASTSILPPGAIAPTEAQRATARKIGRILQRHAGGRGLPDATQNAAAERIAPTRTAHSTASYPPAARQIRAAPNGAAARATLAGSANPPLIAP